MKTMDAFRDRYKPLQGEERMADHPWDNDLGQDNNSDNSDDENS